MNYPSNTLLTDDELSMVFYTAGAEEDCWLKITQAQDAKTARLLIEEIDSYLQKIDDYSLVLDKSQWESFKKSKGV